MKAPTKALRQGLMFTALSERSGALSSAVPFDEQLVWLRHYAQVQQRVSQTVRQMAARIEALEADLMRHRAQAILERTAKWWAVPMRSSRSLRAPLGVQSDALPRSAARPDFGLQAAAPAANRSAVAAPAAWRASDEVLCQTGCASHAHHWLDADGHCQRKGGECERVQAQGGAYVSGA